jgi:hypothetical protein
VRTERRGKARARRLALAAGLAAALVLAGCGSGGSDPAPLTKAEFTKQADAICSRAAEKRIKSSEAALKQQDSRTMSPKQQQQALEALILNIATPPIVQMTEELGELNPPHSEQAHAKALLRSLEAEIARIKASPKDVVTGSLGQFAEADQLASQSKLEACAQI